MVLCAVAAVLALSILPAEHLHASAAGRSVLHRHVIDHEVEHNVHHSEDNSLSFDHDDHRYATILDPAFASQRQYRPERPLSTPAFGVVVVPERRIAGSAERIDGPPTHGPPIRIRSLRAPPA